MLSDIERRGLKIQVGKAVKAAGGQENAANVSDRIDRPATFSDYANAALPNRHCPIDVAVEIDQFNGRPIVVSAMARLVGHRLVPLPSATTHKAGNGALARTIGEMAESIAALSEVLDRGGSIEPHRLQAALKELVEGIEAGIEAEARLEEMLQRQEGRAE